jgi:HupE / UreJ protein
MRAAFRAFALVAAIGATAHAHDRGTSYSSWTIDGRDARVVLRVADLDLSRLEWGRSSETELGERASEGLRLFAGARPCEVAEHPRRITSEEGVTALEWRLRCPADGALALHDDLLFDVAPSHLHFARVVHDGAAPRERVLSEREREWPLVEGSAIGTSLADYLVLGIEHIASGYDHLAFVLALLLIAGSAREVVTVVTGFTAAHSITLALAVVRSVRPAPAAIEALIGLSIALVAAENLWLTDRRGRILPWLLSLGLASLAVGAAAGFGRVPALTLAGLSLFSACYFALVAEARSPERLRWCVAFLFGLLHGFGFATVLTEAHLPTERLARALFGFNAGVEIGQLAVVAVAWPLLRRIGRPLVLDLASAGILALGVFWFVTRAYG